ncbi:hypothetical protein HJC23_004552 [Cyclotella cryptica]|uniref:Fucosyltransferase n=1 Tax=Cyclotella cryptica TaxID=29204 RepID=A0ABD3QAS1_9STRA
MLIPLDKNSKKVEPSQDFSHPHDSAIKVPPTRGIAKENTNENAPHNSSISYTTTEFSAGSQDLQDEQSKGYDSSTWYWEFIQTPTASSKPYLVVCHRMEDWFYPVSDYFTILRIADGELPPWNATVLLLPDDKFCAEHPYVKEAIKRRNEAPFLDTQGDNSPKLYNGWNDGVFWPESIKSTKVLRLLKDRPALVRLRGEVFWRNKGHSCSDVDFIVDRQKERLFDDCLTIHFVQGVSSAYLREFSDTGLRKGDLGVQATADIYEKRIIHPKANPNITLPYVNFCSFLIRYDPNNLVKMFNSTNYDIDAIVRHMFFRQLSEYKPCTRVSNCGGTPYTSYKCMSEGYKFHITMENSLVDGYISEKLFNGALGSGIPIYFGASDVGSYVNAKSFVYCNISRSVVDEMRTFYPRAPKPRPFLFNRTSTGFWPTEEEMFTWADGYLRSQLEPCVRRVIELDVNDTAFREVLSEPFVTNHDLLSGQYPFRGIELALDAIKNKK